MNQCIDPILILGVSGGVGGGINMILRSRILLGLRLSTIQTIFGTAC